MSKLDEHQPLSFWSMNFGNNEKKISIRDEALPSPWWKFRPRGFPRARIHTRRCLKQEAEKSDIYTYKPSDYSSYDAFVKGHDEVWKYQPIVVAISASAFMIYFFILREENHIDKQLGESLYAQMPQVEESTLLAAIRDCKNRGLDTTDLEKRLKEVREAQTVK